MTLPGDTALGDPTPSLRSQARSAVLWSALERWGTRAATLLVFLILARVLAPSDFGVMAAATLVLGVAGLLVDAGFGKYLVQARQIDDLAATTVFWISTSVSVACAAVTVIVAPWVAAAFDAPSLPAVLRGLAVTIVLNALSVVPAGLLQRDLKFRPLALRRLWATAASAVVGVTLALLGAGVWALVAQAITTAAVGSAVLYLTTSWRPSLRFSRSRAREAISFGGTLLGIETLSMVGRNADNLLIGIVLGPQALGYYVVGYRILLILLEILTSVTGAVCLPLFSKVRDDAARLRSVFLRGISAGAVVGFPAFAGLAVVAPLLLPFAFGSEWGPSVPVMQWLTLAGLVQSLTYFNRPLLLAVGRARLELVVTALATVGNVIAFAVAVPYGISAVAAAFAIRHLAFWPVRIWTVRYAGIGTRAYLATVAPAALAAAAAAAAAAVPAYWLDLPQAPLLRLALAVPAAAVVFCVVLWLVSPQTVRQLVAMLR